MTDTTPVWLDTGDRFNSLVAAANACKGTPMGIGMVTYYAPSDDSGDWGTVKRVE